MYKILLIPNSCSSHPLPVCCAVHYHFPIWETVSATCFLPHLVSCYIKISCIPITLDRLIFKLFLIFLLFRQATMNTLIYAPLHTGLRVASDWIQKRRLLSCTLSLTKFKEKQYFNLLFCVDINSSHYPSQLTGFYLPIFEFSFF